MTKAELISSKIYKQWIAGKNVEYIHNVYWDSDKPELFPAYIVITSDSDMWTITRFFTFGSKIQVSVDQSGISIKQLIEALLTIYSRGWN